MRTNIILTYLFILPTFLFLLIACADPSGLTLQDRRKTAEVFFQKGIKNKAEGNKKNARRHFTKAINVDSLFSDAYAAMAQMLISDGEDRRAEFLLTLAHVKLKSEARILRLLGQAQFNQNKVNEAISNLEKSLEIEPSDREALWMLTQLYYKVENYELASLHIEHLIDDSLLADQEKVVSLSQKIDMILSSRNPMASFEMKMMQEIRQAPEVTRGQFAMLLCHEFKQWFAFADTGAAFFDVSPDDAMLIYYRKTIASQVFELLPDGKFYPQHIITRRNLAHYLCRILKIKGINTHLLANDILLTDVSPDDLQFDAIRTVCALKLLMPQKNGHFGSDDSVTGKELTGSVQSLKALLKAR